MRLFYHRNSLAINYDVNCKLVVQLQLLLKFVYYFYSFEGNIIAKYLQ